MPIAPLLSGLATLAGSGMAIAKTIRDDRASRYPPEYLMYKDMMKMVRKGYPVGMMGMMNPMLYQQPMMGMGMMYQQPQQIPQIPVVNPQYVSPQMNMGNQQQLLTVIQQAIQQYQQQQQTNQLVSMIQQLLVQQQPRRQFCMIPQNGYVMPQSVVQQQPQTNNLFGNFQFQMPDFSALANKQLWDTPADGGMGDSYQPAEFLPMIVQPPMQMPPPPSRPVYQPPPQPQPQVIKYRASWVEPYQAIMNEQPIQPMYVNRELTWETANAFSVDNQGLQSFINRLDQQSGTVYPRDNYIGNAW